MSKYFQFTSATKDEVNLFVDGQFERNIHNAHRFWHEFEVQKAIDAGEVREHDYKEPVTIEVAFKDKYEEINQWRDKEESKPDMTVEVKGVPWDANEVAIKRIERTLLSTFIPPFWTDANNVDRHELEGKSFGKADLEAIHNAIVDIGFKIHERQRQLKTELEALKAKEGVTSDEILAFVVGWPEPEAQPSAE
ncbi:DUF4376 domain-containing protein [Vibrio europaeus]|uniref:DUF4376 domain-containing protein n=1 Tax=Vibrio europaeus TaxID=300876 RepID=UPI00233EFA11|nr:DUF4376 domain-containing protein [Vibrio europaeus]MDC5753527.1 DUF4376 domain-containing protein [Vibrio europaeus]MDC5816560.1 DUF4376 domain-containing protein [Vibrio europaeus]